MTKFIKPVNLWDVSTQRALKDGSLVLQCGQWVKCGSDGELSRFISINDIGYINAVHKGASGKQQRRNFIFRSTMHRLQQQVDKGILSHIEFKQQVDNYRVLTS